MTAVSDLFYMISFASYFLYCFTNYVIVYFGFFLLFYLWLSFKSLLALLFLVYFSYKSQEFHSNKCDSSSRTHKQKHTT